LGDQRSDATAPHYDNVHKGKPTPDTLAS
jgi:hypothetical protein